MPYRIQGTVIFPNGTSVYADHELPSDPGNVDQILLFRGLFQLAGSIKMGQFFFEKNKFQKNWGHHNCGHNCAPRLSRWDLVSLLFNF